MGDTFAVSVEGEGSWSLKLPWWEEVFNPLRNARISVYAEARAYLTYKKCYFCRIGECGWKRGNICIRGEIGANVSVIGEVGGRLAGQTHLNIK